MLDFASCRSGRDSDVKAWNRRGGGVPSVAMAPNMLPVAAVQREGKTREREKNDRGRRERGGALDLLARGEVRGGRGVLLVLLPIAGGDGWLDPLGVEVSASAGGKAGAMGASWVIGSEIWRSRSSGRRLRWLVEWIRGR